MFSPHFIPPQPDRPRFEWSRAFIGALLGAAVGVVAHLLDASPWWWLAIPLGLLLANTSVRFSVSILWGRK